MSNNLCVKPGNQPSSLKIRCRNSLVFIRGYFTQNLIKTGTKGARGQTAKTLVKAGFFHEKPTQNQHISNTTLRGDPPTPPLQQAEGAGECVNANFRHSFGTVLLGGTRQSGGENPPKPKPTQNEH
jgi:hypothetical protein